MPVPVNTNDPLFAVDSVGALLIVPVKPEGVKSFQEVIRKFAVPLVNVCIVYPPTEVTVPPVAFCEPAYLMITTPEPPTALVPPPPYPLYPVPPPPPPNPFVPATGLVPPAPPPP